MIRVAAELQRLSTSLIVRGALMVTLGLAAALWPEACLVPALMGVGVIAALFGLYEMAIGGAIRRRATRWWLVVVHGLSLVFFGLLTVGVAIPRLDIALAFIGAWLAAYAALACRAALYAREFPGARRTLAAGASVNGALAVIVLSYGATTIFALLYLGAVYAIGFGAWQVLAGMGLERLLRAHQGKQYDGVIVTAKI